MRPCPCTQRHEPRRVVLTGGPGAGKTAVLELVRHSLCRHVQVLPESAGIVFGGGFPRGSEPEVRRAGQRAIFFVQRELEAAADGANAAVTLCDRGTVDGSAYWPGPHDLWSSVGTTLREQLGRYYAVIHLRTPAPDQGYDHTNVLRIETAAQTMAIDARIGDVWSQHPRRFTIEASPDFLDKAQRAVAILADLVPECCRQHLVPALDRPGSDA
ncbi:MAG: AAA family ATPase [Propionibacterium sp.]